MYKNIFFIIFMIVLSAKVPAQDNNDYIKVIGDSLVGKVLNGENIREVYGNVILTHGNITITCEKAVQYLANNNAELIGNVVATQENMTITTPVGFYYGNERKSKSVSGVTLDDSKVILTAETGEYFFDEDKAFFQNNVKLYDTVTTLTSQKLTYYKNQNKAVAVGGVTIVDSSNIINADSLIHFRDDRISFAFNNVRIRNISNNTIIYGDHLEDYANNSYSIIDKNPLLFQIDTTYITERDTSTITGDTLITKIKLDTLLISSKIMEAFRDTLNYFRAKDSVEIVRGEFASNNDFTIYYRKEEKIVTEKSSEESRQPVLWYANSQLTGDSVTIYLSDNKITRLDVNRNAFLLSQNKIYRNRFDQTSAHKIFIFFGDNGIEKTELNGDVLSIYYLFEDDQPNGLTKSSSSDAVIYFEDNEVSEVRLYGSPASEYYPENKVIGSELAFTLPGYVFHKDRPQTADLLKKIPVKEEIVINKTEN